MSEKRTLSEHRRKAVLSIRELAEKANLSPATISRIEKGHVKQIWPATMRAIAEALNVASSDIAEFAPMEPSSKGRRIVKPGQRSATGGRFVVVQSRRPDRAVIAERRTPLPPPTRTEPDSSAMEAAILSEDVLARDWLTPEEDEYWAHL